MDYNENMLSGSPSISHFNSRNIAIWFSMAFQGGAINAGGFIACHRFVTHATGFATLFGTEAAQGHFLMAFGFLTVPLFFLSGSMASAYYVDRKLAQGEIPRYGWVFGFISLTMILIAIGGSMGIFGVFGDTSSLSSDYLLVALLCFCSGLQNATISSASGAVVRTTHLTGVTTDLGIGLVRAFTSGQTTQMRENEKRFNWMRMGLIFSFAMGSTVSAFLFYQFEYWGFLGPALISFWLVALVIRKRILSRRHGVNHARAS
jgi:uncharacterized membrane protein YoaK (UPF0700 family)